MKPRLLTVITALLTAWPFAGARAEVRSVTLGVRMNCPYGLAG